MAGGNAAGVAARPAPDDPTLIVVGYARRDQVIHAFKSALTLGWTLAAATAAVILLHLWAAFPVVRPEHNGPLPATFAPAAWAGVAAGALLAVRLAIRDVPVGVWSPCRRWIAGRLATLAPAVKEPGAPARRQAPATIDRSCLERPGEVIDFASRALDEYERQFGAQSTQQLFTRIAFPRVGQARVSERIGIAARHYDHRVSRTVEFDGPDCAVAGPAPRRPAAPSAAPSRLRTLISEATAASARRGHAFGSRRRPEAARGPTETDPPPALVPVLRVRKSELVDDLGLTVDSGSVSTLSYLESQGAIIAVLSALVVAIYQAGGVRSERTREKFGAAVAVVTSPNPEHDLGAIIARELHESVTADLAGHAGPAATEMVGILASCVEYFAENYLVVAAVVPGADRVRITASHRMPVQRIRRSDKPIANWPLEAVGGAVVAHQLPLMNVAEAVSAHIYVDIPETAYVFRFRYAYRTGPHTIKHVDWPSEQDYAGRGSGFARSRTLDYVHLYRRAVRPSGGPESTGLQEVPSAYVELRERPPGLAAVLSLVLSILSRSSW